MPLHDHPGADRLLRGDVVGHGLDLRGREPVLERRHAAAAGGHDRLDRGCVGLELVKVRPDRARRRFACITATGALLAVGGFGAVVGAIYGLVPGLVAAAALLPAYCFIAFVLRMLLASFDVEA